MWISASFGELAAALQMLQGFKFIIHLCRDSLISIFNHGSSLTTLLKLLTCLIVGLLLFTPLIQLFIPLEINLA